MTTQLTLIPTIAASWQLDERTRAVGRQGLAEARRTLAEAKLRLGDQPTAVDPFTRAA